MGTTDSKRTGLIPIKLGQLACAVAFALAATAPHTSWAAPKSKPKKAATKTAAIDLPKAAIHVCVLDSQTSGCTPLSAFNHNDTRQTPPASLNKMMTGYLLYQHMIENGHKLDDVFAAITAQDRDEGMGTRRGAILRQVPTGTKLTYREFFHALTVKSANDAAVRVAKEIAGSETAFAALMTETAQQIGLTETTFRNASGMPAQGQKTTAHDMSLLIAHISQSFGSIEQFRTLFGQADTTIAGKEVKGHIPWLRQAESGILGAKTGTINGVSNITALTQIGNQLMAITVMAGSASARGKTLNHLLKTLGATPAIAPTPTPTAARLMPVQKSEAPDTSSPDTSSPAPKPAPHPPVIRTETAEAEPMEKQTSRHISQSLGLCTGWEDLPKLLTSLGVPSRSARLSGPDGQM